MRGSENEKNVAFALRDNRKKEREKDYLFSAERKEEEDGEAKGPFNVLLLLARLFTSSSSL